jgi:hypothetical protein
MLTRPSRTVVFPDPWSTAWRRPVFRMLTPRALGGFEVPPLTFPRVVEETARIDGSTGWCLFIGGGIRVQGAFIAEEAARDVSAAILT